MNLSWVDVGVDGSADRGYVMCLCMLCIGCVSCFGDVLCFFFFFFFWCVGKEGFPHARGSCYAVDLIFVLLGPVHKLDAALCQQ